jgi:hypothetical protein
MQMWGGGSPFRFDPSQFTAVFERAVADPRPDPPPYWVVVTVPPGLNGQTISLLSRGVVIGKAVISGDTVRIPADLAEGTPQPGDLEVALEPDGAQPVRIPVRENQTTLTQNCPADDQFHSNNLITISGKLTGAPAGSTVDVKWTTRNDDEVVERTVETHPTTDAEGNWSTSLQSDHFEDGTWTVESSYAGGDGRAPSRAPDCSFHVQDNS